MIVSRVILKNWRNFRSLDVSLGQRVFLVGPNACGKSNFLDVFRFLRDIVKPGGGLQSALNRRGGLSKIRCLSAQRSSDVEIELHIGAGSGDRKPWRYAIGIKQQPRGRRHTYLIHEKVWQGNKLLLRRPDKNDKNDDLRLTQTHLEQISVNKTFRDIYDFFESVSYLHIVPQLIRHPGVFAGRRIPDDPFGQNFMERVADTPDKTRKARLKKIRDALSFAVPQLKELTDTRDNAGVPHLEAVYQHWHSNAGKQNEEQFSDGTLRLIGLLWSLLEKDSLLLLEEPELSLNTEIIRKLPALMYRLQKRHCQMIVSTHSADMLSDKGVGAEETLLLLPGKEGTEVRNASSVNEIQDLLEGGVSIADAALPMITPKNIHQLELFR